MTPQPQSHLALRRARFLTDLEVTPLADGQNWRLTRRLEFFDARGEFHVVPKGFVTDFASIPPLGRIGYVMLMFGLAVFGLGLFVHQSEVLSWLGFVLWMLGSAVIWLACDFDDDERLDGPAVLHDDGYRRPRLGRRPWKMKLYWDRILFQAMRANGVPYWKAWLVWFNVAVFGWLAWQRDAAPNQEANHE